jgi:serine/threonine protein kinase
MDENCPNFDDHGQEHIDRLEFLRLIRAQLAVDRGRDADSVPLYLSGSLGSLFKVRLSSHGYTLVAKGMESLDLARLWHENELYDRLQTIQGKYVPVCLGRVDLVLPHYYDGGVYVHFLFLSWAGRPLFECINQIDKASVVNAVTTAFTELHKLRVLHCDAEPRNILYDVYSDNLMIVDFERAQFHGRQPLGSISLNAQDRKRKRKTSQKTSQKRENDVFARELQSVVECVSRCHSRRQDVV